MTTSMTSAPIPTTDGEEVLAVLTKLYAAWADNDATAFARLYLEDATVAMPGVVHETREEIRDYMAHGFAGPLKGSRAVDEPISVRMLGLDAAVILSRAGILMPGESEIPLDRERIATWVLAKRGGAWWIAAYSNVPANVAVN
jgi:uncharacterized protein (TIGR02246 family)